MFNLGEAGEIVPVEIPALTLHVVNGPQAYHCLAENVHAAAREVDFRIDREFLCFLGKLLLFEVWLGGLDSNQDSQIQNLESCQLDDLPTLA